MENKHIFPWGIPLGELVGSFGSFPLLIDSSNGGFIVLFDETSEEMANDLIENISLALLDVMPLKSLKVNIIDYGKKRFLHLAELVEFGVYHIAYTQKRGNILFDEVEDLALSRHHNLIGLQAPTLSEYNVLHDTQEEFHLLVINLDHFPDDTTSPTRIKNFFSTAFDAGFFTIAFGTKEILETKSTSKKAFLDIFPHIYISNKQLKMPKELFTDQELFDMYEFRYINQNKTSILEDLFKRYKKEEQNEETKDFLNITIGTIGNKPFTLNMGLKSQNYHGFIAGMTGMGKTNLLNTIIVEIAKNYTVKEIELYLMDYKPAGAEFGIYKNHPNCKKLFLNNQDLQPALEMLEYFQEVMYSRGKILNGLSIDEYNDQYPDKKLPHKLLIIDEVQRMFGGEWSEAGRFNTLLEDIIKAGRSYGLHVILTTQSLRQINMKDTIKGQISLKISFRLDDTIEATKIFSENKEAIKEVTKLRPYHLLYTDSNNTQIVKSNYLPKKSIDKILEDIRQGRREDELTNPEIITATKEDVKNSEVVLDKNDKFDNNRSKYDTSSAKKSMKKLQNKLEENNE